MIIKSDNKQYISLEKASCKEMVGVDGRHIMCSIDKPQTQVQVCQCLNPTMKNVNKAGVTNLDVLLQDRIFLWKRKRDAGKEKDAVD